MSEEDSPVPAPRRGKGKKKGKADSIEAKKDKVEVTIATCDLCGLTKSWPFLTAYPFFLAKDWLSSHRPLHALQERATATRLLRTHPTLQ